MSAGYVKYKKVRYHTVSNFPGCRLLFIRKSAVRSKRSPTKDSRRGLGAAIRLSSRVLGAGSGPYGRQPDRSGYMLFCYYWKPCKAWPCSQISIIGQDIRKRLACDLPVLLSCCCQHCKQSGKVDRILQRIYKGVDRFLKKLHFCNHQDVSFRVSYFTCNDIPDPFQRTVGGGGSLDNICHLPCGLVLRLNEIMV